MSRNVSFSSKNKPTQLIYVKVGTNDSVSTKANKPASQLGATPTATSDVRASVSVPTHKPHQQKVKVVPEIDKSLPLHKSSKSSFSIKPTPNQIAPKTKVSRGSGGESKSEKGTNTFTKDEAQGHDIGVGQKSSHVQVKGQGQSEAQESGQGPRTSHGQVKGQGQSQGQEIGHNQISSYSQTKGRGQGQGQETSQNQRSSHSQTKNQGQPKGQGQVQGQEIDASFTSGIQIKGQGQFKETDPSYRNSYSQTKGQGQSLGKETNRGQIKGHGQGQGQGKETNRNQRGSVSQSKGQGQTQIEGQESNQGKRLSQNQDQVQGYESGQGQRISQTQGQGQGAMGHEMEISQEQIRYMQQNVIQNPYQSSYGQDQAYSNSAVYPKLNLLSNSKEIVKLKSKSKGRRAIPAHIQTTRSMISSHSSDSLSELPDQFVFSMLNKTESHFIADEDTSSDEAYRNLPPGLEVLTSILSLRVCKREILSAADNKDVFYRAFCQYDIRNSRASMTNIAIGLETTSCSPSYCCMDARLFNICLYDYKTEMILRVQRRWSCAFCVAKYYLLCCWTGWDGCGNIVDVYDAYGELIGTIKQCRLFTKRLIFLQESNSGSHAMGRPNFTWSQIFCHLGHVWRDIRVKKFDVMNAKGKAEVRIEQYLPGGNLFKFIYLDEIFNAGHCRKSGENEYNIELWKYFSEKQKAVLIGSSFLLDHICFNISIEGSYVNELRVEQESKRFRGFFTWCRDNRCRRIQFVVLSVVIIVYILYHVTYSLTHK